MYNAVAGFNVFPVKRPLSSLPATNVRSALREFHVPPPSLLPQALLVYLLSHMGRKRNRVQRVDKITQLQDVAETQIPLSKHTMMPNPFPEMSEVNGGQKVPEPRSDLSKNTSLVEGGGNSSRGGCWGNCLVGTLGHFDAPLVSDAWEQHPHTQQLSS